MSQNVEIVSNLRPRKILAEGSTHRLSTLTFGRTFSLFTIYVIFVLLFLSFRELEKHPSSSERTRLANALHMLAEDAPSGLPQEDKNEVLWLLHAYDAHDARLHLLADAVEQMPVVPPSKPGVLNRMVRSIRTRYVRLVHSPYFAGIVSSCFIAYALLFTVVMVFGSVHMGQLVASKITQDVVQIGLLVSSW